MKRNIKYNKLVITGALLLLIVSFLDSCVKSRAGRTDFDSLKPVVTIPEGGLKAFSSQALLFPGADPADTTYFYINYAATNVAPVDETITLSVDPAALAAYNSLGNGQYTLFPDSIFSFTTTQITVKKGNNYSDQVPLIVFPSKIDPTQNFMLPISIKTAPAGSTISTNFGTIYYHLIGNPLAGSYAMTGARYNYTGSVLWGGPPDPVPAGGAITPYAGDVAAAPVDTHTVQIIMGNVPDPVSGPAYYFITGDATFATISIDFESAFNSGYSNIHQYIVNYTPPSPTQKASFHLMTKYNNTTGNAGNDRLIDQTFTQK